MSAPPPSPKTEKINMALAIHNWQLYPVMTWPWVPLTEKEESWLRERAKGFNPTKKWLALTPGSLSAQLYWVFVQPLHDVAKGKADTESE